LYAHRSGYGDPARSVARTLARRRKAASQCRTSRARLSGVSASKPGSQAVRNTCKRVLQTAGAPVGRNPVVGRYRACGGWPSPQLRVSPSSICRPSPRWDTRSSPESGWPREIGQEPEFAHALTVSRRASPDGRSVDLVRRDLGCLRESSKHVGSSLLPEHIRGMTMPELRATHAETIAGASLHPGRGRALGCAKAGEEVGSGGISKGAGEKRVAAGDTAVSPRALNGTR